MKVGELLVQENLIDLKQLQLAKQEQKQKGGRLIQHLAGLGYINESDIALFFSKQFQLPTIELSKFELSPELAKMLSKEICLKHGIVPVSKVGNSLVVAFSDPTSQHLIVDDLRYITHSKVEMVIATESSIKKAIERLYGAVGTEEIRELVETIAVSDDIVEIKGGDDSAELGLDVEAANDDPIVKLVNTMLIQAIREGASDIHVEPYEKNFRIRFRIDGNLHSRINPPQAAASSIISRLKILAKLDIAERRLPQDGRLSVKFGNGRVVDFRVSVLPTMFGEKVVLRILDKESLQLDLSKLGFDPPSLALFRKKINLPQGMVLLTGPTGSGKTTTIYSALAELNKEDVNICTAEDPVEFDLNGINQVQVRADINLTFAAALRSFLRQDPDIILVGEIRDLETAEIAFKAASTGHLVVSTLHTNDAPGTITRLVDIGIQPYMVASGVNLIVAQRLVAKLCSKCKEPFRVEPQVLRDLGVAEGEIGDYKVFQPKGCNICLGIGYKGRMAIYEMLALNEGIRDAIMAGKNESEIRNAALAAGMMTLRMSALQKLKEGLTSIDEVVKVTMKD